MLSAFSLMMLFCFVMCTFSNGAPLKWRTESSAILRSLGINPSFIFDLVSALHLDDDSFGLENINLLEGDIILHEITRKGILAVHDQEKLWPDGNIPYIIETSLGERKSDIENAMTYIERETCLRFIKRTNEKNYVRIFKGNGCNSLVGMLGDGAQSVSLGPGCYKQGKIMHELLHTVGFYHEQSRADRDDYINIHWRNIKPGHERNFAKRIFFQNNQLTPYAYESVMHYSSYSFSKNKARGLRTMTSKKKGVVLKSPGEKVLSTSDIKRIIILYNCTSKKYY